MNDLEQVFMTLGAISAVIAIVFLLLSSFICSVGIHIVGKITGDNIGIIKTTGAILLSWVLATIVSAGYYIFMGKQINDYGAVGIVTYALVDGFFIAKFNDIGFIRATIIGFFGGAVGILLMIGLLLALSLAMPKKASEENSTQVTNHSIQFGI